MSCSWLHPTVDLSSCGWIQVAGYSVLWLTWVSTAGYKLQLTPSYGWLEPLVLDTTLRWFHPATDSSYGSLIRVAADSILWLTWVPQAGLDLQLFYTLCLCLLFSLFLKEQCSFWLFQTKWFEKKFNLQLLYLPIVSWTFILSWATTHCPPS